MGSIDALPGFKREASRVSFLSSGEEYPWSMYLMLLIGWKWARECGWGKVRPLLCGGNPMGEKLLPKSLDDMEGEAGDSARMNNDGMLVVNDDMQPLHSFVGAARDGILKRSFCVLCHPLKPLRRWKGGDEECRRCGGKGVGECG